jgi:hypothetical protein
MTKEEAIYDFNAEAHFSSAAMSALSHVLSLRPRTLMITFEMESGSIGMASVPASYQLMRALSDAAYEKLWAVDIEGEDDDEGIVE